MSKILTSNDPLGKSLEIASHTFPGIWRYMMPPEFLALRFPEERRSTCMDCPKSCYEGFRKDYRCCTYHPRIPNFLLGLAYDQGDAREPIDWMIQAGMATPEGMLGTPQQWIHYLADVEYDRFGKSDKVLCPMLNPENQLCRVHAFRNSVCSTFFCLRDHGEVGSEFWNKVQALGSQLEMALAQWALREVGFDFAGYVKTLNRLAPKIKKVADPQSHGWRREFQAELWGSWLDREVELFWETGKLISDHREHLWEIASHQDITEAKAYDRAMVAMVPEDLHDQVDDGDWADEDSETVAPRELWARCFRTYQRLWQLPFGDYRLAAKVRITENVGRDAEDQFYSTKPYCLEVHTSSRHNDVDWRLYLSEQDKAVLDEFRKVQTLDWRLLKTQPIDQHPNPQGFLSEMIASRIVVRAQSKR